MATFTYRAMDKERRIVHGTMEAPNQDELISTLQGRGLLVTSVVAGEEALAPERKAMRLHRRVKLDDLAILARQLATLLGAGVTLLRAMEIAAEQVGSSRLKSALEEVRRDIEAGSTLKDALAKHPKIFSLYWVSLVETGESSGKLPDVFTEIARYLERMGSFMRKVVSAMIYPVILVIVAIGVLSFFIIRIVPTFADMFKGFDVSLPPLTRMVISVSTMVRQRLLYIIVALVGFGFIIYRYIHTKGGRWRLDQLKLKLPIFGTLFHMMTLNQFARGLATLVESGVPILHALEIIGRTSGNMVMEKAIEGVKTGVRDGKTISGPLSREELFPPMVVHMVGVGEETGELGSMLGKVSDYYEERVDAFVTRLASVFEPALILFMGAVIGVLVVSMFLPIISIAQIAGR